MAESPPLILTLQIYLEAFEYFNKLRKEHFPPKINYLDAHLTLFHHLPNLPSVTEWVDEVASNQGVISMDVTGLMKLGRGVAFKIDSKELMQLHSYLKKQWLEWLTPQDQQSLRPHVTIQNKVEPAVANELYTKLSTSFLPFKAEAIGLSLWEYHGGPWSKVNDYKFCGGK